MHDAALRDELLRMARADLALRDALVLDGTLFDGYAPAMAELHRRHNARLADVLAAFGWPGRTLVGEDGAEAAWLVVQHAILDPALMRAAVRLLERAVAAGEADAKHLAMLVDRIRTLEGGPQVYGTQHDWDGNGELSPAPIEDAAGVDARRARVGLEPIAENTRRLRAQSIAEGERAPLDGAERRRAAADWARSVGWRR